MKHAHGGNVHAFATQQDIAMESIVDFSANINPIGLSPRGWEAMLTALGDIVHYPDPQQERLRQAIRDRYHMPGESIIIGNGAAEIMYALCRMRSFAGALVPAPGFSEYRLASEAAGIPVQSYALTQKQRNERHIAFTVPYETLIRQASQFTAPHLIFVGNPNNPDGGLAAPEEIRRLAKACQSSGSYVVVDESFIDFTDDSTSVRQDCLTAESLIVIHSLTKSCAIPGLRLGVTFVHPAVQERLAMQIPTWSTNQLAQVYGEAALRDIAYQVATVRHMETERAWMLEQLAALPLVHTVPSVNFILLYLPPTAMTVTVLQQELAKKYILVRSCEMYEGLGAGWFRIAIKLREDNERLIAALKEVL